MIFVRDVSDHSSLNLLFIVFVVVQAHSDTELQELHHAHSKSTTEAQQLLAAANASIDDLEGQIIGRQLAVEAAENALASAQVHVRYITNCRTCMRIARTSPALWTNCFHKHVVMLSLC